MGEEEQVVLSVEQSIVTKDEVGEGGEGEEGGRWERRNE